MGTLTITVRPPGWAPWMPSASWTPWSAKSFANNSRARGPIVRARRIQKYTGVTGSHTSGGRDIDVNCASKSFIELASIGSVAADASTGRFPVRSNR
jgi:hypothetical protein